MQMDNTLLDKKMENIKIRIFPKSLALWLKGNARTVFLSKRI